MRGKTKTMRARVFARMCWQTVQLQTLVARKTGEGVDKRQD